MNVSRNAYFTSEYLEDLKQPLRSRKPTGTRRSHQNTRQFSSSSYYGRPSPPIAKTNPDELMEEITPAELNCLSHLQPQPTHKRMVNYYNYHKPRSVLKFMVKGEMIFDGDALSYVLCDKRKHAMPGQGDFSGYYIDQKKKYDAAKEIKPSLYTHRTFKDVFYDDTEERLNPMDVVFKDSTNEGLNDCRVLSKAFRKVQKMVGYENCTSFDYFEQNKFETKRLETFKNANSEENETAKKVNKSTMRNLFVFKKDAESGINEFSGLKDISKEPDAMASEGDEEVPISKRSSRSKWKFLKRSEDYEGVSADVHRESMPGSNLLLAEESEAKIENDRDCEKLFCPGEKPNEVFVGPRENLRPFLKSLLSWIFYDRIQDIADGSTKKGKIEELIVCEPSESPRDSEISSSKLFKRIRLLNGKKHRDVLKRWNDPASNYLIQPPKFFERRNIMAGSSFNSDAILGLEVDFEIGEIADELIYNPKTGMLEALPSKRNAGKMGFRTQYGSPVTIVSSVSQLIKSVKIMRNFFAPIDVIADNFPRLQTLVIIIELGVFAWILYEFSLLIDALCMAIKAVCAPMIAVGRLMNRIM